MLLSQQLPLRQTVANAAVCDCTRRGNIVLINELDGLVVLGTTVIHIRANLCGKTKQFTVCVDKVNLNCKINQ